MGQANNQATKKSDICHQALIRRKELRTRFAKNLDEIYPSPNDIDQVIVVLGSSRSGSSLLHHLLSLHPEIISLQGEEVTFTKLFGLNSILSVDDSDCLKEYPVSLTEVAQEILYDAGYNTSSTKRLALDRAARLILQWPHIAFDLEFLLSTCEKSDWNETLIQLQKRYPEITTALYDQSLLPQKQEREFYIEEPPFVVPRAKSYKSNSKKKTLLLKSSVNAFRAEYLTKLFPQADFHFIHLTRNPAASINGLIDGWLSPAFHSHNVGKIQKLEIKNYNNSNWWKFDLPPGWKKFTNKSLAEVCAFQWYEANRSILHFLENKESCKIKYEEILEKKLTSLEPVFKKLELSSEFLNEINLSSQVMSVHSPRPYRWRDREEMIYPLIQNDKIKLLAFKLGYDVTNIDELK